MRRESAHLGAVFTVVLLQISVDDGAMSKQARPVGVSFRAKLAPVLLGRIAMRNDQVLVQPVNTPE